MIETTVDGTVVDRYRVIDSDHAGPVPAWRIAEVANALRDALLKKVDIPALIRRHQPYGASSRPARITSSRAICPLRTRALSTSRMSIAASSASR